MKHEIIQEKIWLITDPELSGEERSEILAHAKECASCRQILEGWQLLKNGLAQGSAVQVPGGFVQNVMDRIEALEKPSEEIPALSWLHWLLPGLAYTFAFVLMIGAITYASVPLTTEEVLLSDLPEPTSSTLTFEQPDITALIGNEENI